MVAVADKLAENLPLTSRHNRRITNDNDQLGNIRLILNRAETLKPMHASEFSTVMHLCKHWLQLSDLLALHLAFVCGGAITWIVDTYWLKSGFQQVWNLQTFKQFVIYMGLGAL